MNKNQIFREKNICVMKKRVSGKEKTPAANGANRTTRVWPKIIKRKNGKMQWGEQINKQMPKAY